METFEEIVHTEQRSQFMHQQEQQITIPKSTLYSRTGDTGTSQLFNNERKSKTDPVFHALGNTDELNSVLGVVREYCKQANNGLDEYIPIIQSVLTDVMTSIATPQQNSKQKYLDIAKFDPEHTIQVEKWIDELDFQLPKLKNLILPGGGLSASYFHVARSTCRRAERSVHLLVAEGQVEPAVAAYMNRLSDFFFAAARTAAKREGQEETIYQKGKGRTVRQLSDS